VKTAVLLPDTNDRKERGKERPSLSRVKVQKSSTERFQRGKLGQSPVLDLLLTKSGVGRRAKERSFSGKGRPKCEKNENQPTLALGVDVRTEGEHGGLGAERETQRFYREPL